MITIIQEPVNRRSYRSKTPYYLFKRLDLTTVRPVYQVFLHVGKGGDYLLKRITMRWSEVCVEPETNLSPLTVSLSKSSSIYHYFEEIDPKVFTSPCDSRDSEISAAPLPVDNNIYSVLFSKTVRYNAKTFNWLIDDNSVMIIDVRKIFPSKTYPQYVDIVAEGYFINTGVVL